MPDLTAPAFDPEDSIYAGVFLAWDGNWEGKFIIYSDPLGQQSRASERILIDSSFINKLPVSQVIQVHQRYKSISPYYQEVQITDSHIKNNDTIDVESMGVNKVENGKLWCVVQKPEERVVHNGILKKPNTLIWYRHETSPLRKEYFVEEVHDNSYTIMGYGYYGDDNPTLEPRTWFYAKYHHVSDYFR